MCVCARVCVCARACVCQRFVCMYEHLLQFGNRRVPTAPRLRFLSAGVGVWHHALVDARVVLRRSVGTAVADAWVFSITDYSSCLCGSFSPQTCIFLPLACVMWLLV